MTKLEFSYNSLITNGEDSELTDAGMISFTVEFDQKLDDGGFKRACYSVAMDEVISILAEKYGETVFDNPSDISIRVSSLSVN